MKNLMCSASAGMLASAVLAAGATGTTSTTMATATTSVAAKPAAALRVTAVAGEYERAVLRQVNRARARHDLPALRASSCLDVYAEARARRLAVDRELVHHGLGSVFDACGGSMMGENLARGRRFTPYRVVYAWLHSPGHRANVLRPGFRHAAVGAWRASDGSVYVSMLYRAPQ